METGTDLKHLVLLDQGQPTSDLSYALTNQDGATLASGTFTISEGQMSQLIEISAADNVISKPIIEQMTLSWSYTTAAQAVVDQHKYTLHAAVEFPVSIDSVRNMLGVSEEEVPDKDVDLFAGYLYFRKDLPDTTDFTTLAAAGDFDTYRIATAIEAATALQLFPSLQIRLPKAYNSGTSEYERWNSLDWEGLRANLSTRLNEGLSVIDEDLELYEVIDIFGLSDADTDAVTGA